MNMIIYIGFAIAFLVLVLVLAARGANRESLPESTLEDCTPCPGEDRWLSLSERIFDPSDARWLRDELAFPALADSLTESRKQLAIRWLKTLQASFDQFVRTPERLTSENQAGSSESWRLLWLTVRFQCLLFYALTMVRLFGPYHRLIPSFAWMQFLEGDSLRLQPSTLTSNSRFR